MNKLFIKIMTDQYEMSHMGKLKFFLGLQFTQTSNGIFLTKRLIVKDFLRSMKTPMSAPLRIDADLKG